MSQEVIELIQGEKGIELPLATENWVMLREEGYSPVQSLVAAVGACGGYVYQSVLKNSNIAFTFHKVILTYERDMETKPNPVSKIHSEFVISLADTAQAERALRAVKLVNKNCPVIQSLDPNIIIEESVTFI